MTQSENHIGKVLKFDEGSFLHALGGLKRYCLPVVKEMKAHYESSLGTGSFSQKVFTDLVEKGPKNFALELVAFEEEKIKTESETVKELARERYGARVRQEAEAMAQIVDRLHNALRIANQNTQTGSYEMQLNLILVQAGTPVVDEEALKWKFQIRIENDTQANAYVLLMNLKEAWDKASAFLTQNGYDTRQMPFCGSPHGNNGVVYEVRLYEENHNKRGTLEIVPEVIASLK